MLRLKGGGNPVLRLFRSVSTKPQTVLSSCLLLPYIPLSAQAYHSCLHLRSAGINGMGSRVLESPLCELCFSFKQIQSCVAQGGIELTEPSASVS